MSELKTNENLWTRIDKKLEVKIPEVWKFVKWMMMGGLASLVELGAHYLLQYLIFRAILTAPIGGPDWLQPILELLRLDRGQGYLYAYLISITIGYTIAYILNRKVTFKSVSNLALSTTLYAIMVVFTILAGAWIGTTFSVFLANRGWSHLNFLVKPVQMAIPGLWTYPLNRFVILRPSKEAKAEAEADAEANAQEESAE